MKYGISLMDPKAIYFNKLCLRFHSKELLKMSGPELLKKEINIKKNIYDIADKKMFNAFLKKAIENKIKIKKTVNKEL